MITKVIKFKENTSIKDFLRYEELLIENGIHLRSEYLEHSKKIICRFDDEIDFAAFAVVFFGSKVKFL